MLPACTSSNAEVACTTLSVEQSCSARIQWGYTIPVHCVRSIKSLQYNHKYFLPLRYLRLLTNKTSFIQIFFYPTPTVHPKPEGMISSNGNSKTGSTTKYVVMNAVHPIIKIINIFKIPMYQLHAIWGLCIKDVSAFFLASEIAQWSCWYYWRHEMGSRRGERSTNGTAFAVKIKKDLPDFGIGFVTRNCQTLYIQTNKMHKILVIRLYFLLDALHGSGYISPSSGATL